MSEPDCERIFELLSQYLDGELPATTCEQLDRHIRECAPCVEFVESLRESIRLCRQFECAEEPPPVPSPVKESLRKAYEEMRRRKTDA